MIKASDELLAALGVQSQADVIPALLAKLNESNTRLADLSAKVEGIKPEVTADAHLELAASVEKLTEKVNGIAALNEGEILKRAEAKAAEAGSYAAAVALGAVGVNAVAPAPVSEPVKADNAEAFAAAGDYDAAYKASEKLQAEFSSAAVYAAYAKAVKAGRVNQFVPKQ